MLLADPNALQSVLNSNQKLLMSRGFTSPDEINEGNQTYPSALVLPNQKTFFEKACNLSSSVISDVKD